MNVKVYGCRGSIPTSRLTPSRYGGNTSCITLESGGHILIMDAGSGLTQFDIEMRQKAVNYSNSPAAPLDILISHLHIDHIIGITAFGPAWNPSAGVRLYTCLRGEGSLREQIFGAFVPPYFPSSMVEKAVAECIAIKDKEVFNVGPFTITPFDAIHPDSTLSFHITDGNASLVHLLDSETSLMNEQDYAELVDFCRDADIVIFDAAYAPEDYPEKKDFGHSTIEDGFKLAEFSKCKRMMFSRHNCLSVATEVQGIL